MQFCIYCDFYSIKQLGKAGDYIRSLYREIDTRKDEFTGMGSPVETVYFGGGTPSVLSADLLSGILEKILSDYPIGIHGVEEITIETNPDDLTETYLKKLKEAGFNRLSIGIQSFDDRHLEWMNRRHDSRTAINAFRLARRAGFDNINIDLIFGYGLLTMNRWRRDIECVLAMSPEHISAYQMGVERGTQLYKLAYAGSYANVSDDEASRQYAFLQETLYASGFNQYEVSSFSKPGKKSHHNSSYWESKPYMGLGPSAHSFDGKKRSWNSDSMRKYISQSTGRRGEEYLDIRDCFNEFLMLSLRTVSGIDKLKMSAFPAKFLSTDFHLTIDTLIKKGLLEEDESSIRIPTGKMFISDSIIRELLLI